MDLGKKKKFGLEKIGEDPLSYQQAGAPVDWEFGLVAGNSSVSMVDTFCSTLWNNGSRSISTSNAVAIAKPISGTDMNWSSSSSISRGGLVSQTGPGMPAMCLPNFQVDSAFIERAARFSCFNGTDFSGVVHCFGASGASNSHQNGFQGASGAPEDRHGEPKLVDHGSIKESNGLSCNSEEEKQSSGDGIEDSSSKELGSKKRKRTNQEDLEMEQVEGGPQLSAENAKEGVDKKQKAEQETSTMAAAKSSGKQAKDSSNTLKEDFVHVRARRGQATNSHSLAERVRREKISERMKLLQNLVPGCSKVTGKAVMLDEIINYVQSLQRQVEFLSMKLAAVNPRLDFNIEGLLSKDLLQSTNGFTSDVIHPQFHPSQQGFFQAAVPAGMVNPPDALRRAASAQLTTMNPYKESSSQMANAWDEELQNVVQMTFGMNPSISNQELNGKPHNGFPI